ncbi:sulfite exporter TauE/SafE family protein [Streptosporangium sp. NPDC006007]|uniref:sulfite exporter TauE/SafE family protein n=1 Tax=Streptosporangium sp. NPDC006007 TaxID=3154575 RepID=UPI0033B26C94
MTVVAVPALGLLIGAVLGALGGGGAILAVPVLVYLLGQSPQDATTSSLVIVGLTAVFGAVGHSRNGQVRWLTGGAFGVVGVAAAFAGTAVNRLIDPHLLLLGFAALTTVAAAGMLLRARGGGRGDGANGAGHGADGNGTGGVGAGGDGVAEAGYGTAPPPTAAVGGGQLTLTRTGGLRGSPWGARGRTVTMVVKVVLAGLAVGFLTGLFGVGGGFVIVPALVLALGLPMPAAVGTSLFVIAINSGASLAARAGQAHFDWGVIVPFTLAAVAGTVAGRRIADRLPAAILTRSFSILLLGVAVYVAAGSVLALT